ncbi:MAG: hypothetical protein HOV80_14995, partial [Polyangiaceae bacterium]|nr:hypothetical protein [Polyangiaceae bacterium]
MLLPLFAGAVALAAVLCSTETEADAVGVGCVGSALMRGGAAFRSGCASTDGDDG